MSEQSKPITPEAASFSADQALKDVAKEQRMQEMGTWANAQGAHAETMATTHQNATNMIESGQTAWDEKTLRHISVASRAPSQTRNDLAKSNKLAFPDAIAKYQPQANGDISVSRMGYEVDSLKSPKNIRSTDTPETKVA